MTTSDSPGRISKQKAAIAALLTAPTIEEAASRAGVSEATLHRWLKQDAFLHDLRQAEEAAIDAATRQLIGLASDAGAVLADMVTSKDATPATRLRAAGMVYDFLLRLRESRDFGQRLAALEAAANEQ